MSRQRSSLRAPKLGDGDRVPRRLAEGDWHRCVDARYPQPWWHSNRTANRDRFARELCVAWFGPASDRDTLPPAAGELTDRPALAFLEQRPTGLHPVHVGPARDFEPADPASRVAVAPPRGRGPGVDVTQPLAG